MVNLELYRIFKIVADEENLTKASEILNISQPAVTKHIHNLESELNIKLFERTRYGMVLTEDGRKIYNHIKEAVNTLISVEDSLNQITKLNLGIHTNFPQKLYSNVIEKLKQNIPGIDISIEKTYTENMFDLLDKQKIDAYLSKKQPESIHADSINFIGLGCFHDDFYIRADSKYLNKHILKDDESITIYTLRNISSTSHNLEQILRDRGLSNIEIKNATFATIYEKMKNEDIIAYITGDYIEDEIRSGKFIKLDTDVKTFEVEYGIYYNSNNKIKNIKKLFENIK